MTEDFADKLNKYEQKWQEKWDEENIFEADPNNDEKFFITVAYPYPSGGMHLGHARTFTLPDVFARFQRMKGKNVLFPMAWHVTGSTINGALKRLHEGEEKQLDTLKNTFNVSQEDLDSMEEPMDYANYFIENSYRPSMEKLGFSVDWRREFNTNEEQYNKFIEWQYQRLNEKGLISKGKHPTRYCLNEKNSVNDHGLLEGEDSEKQEYTLVKFKQDSRVFPMATLRPETVFGVTHALINPEQDYVVAEVDGEEWVISEEAAEKINQQNREVEIIQESKGEEFVGEEVTNPVTGDEVLLLPATFVDPDQSTGVVMSVPAHSPYDWISLEDLKQDEELVKEYGLDPEEVKSIEPVSIINLEGYGDFPAKEACEEYGVRSQEDEALEKATEEVYEEELHHGKMNASCQDFTGEDVRSARDKIKNQFTNMGRFDSMWELSDETICRCGGKVVVSKQETWFVDYSQEDWKEKARELLDEIEIIPEKSRSQFEHIIEWLEERPLIRNYGLGTKLPFDDDFIIEPLADSTIYMSFYTIKHIIEDVDAEKLEPAFFDYVFTEEGNIEEVAKDTGIEEKVIEDARKSFDYWYPLDWRTSANELIDNHLSFFMFHHTALFEEDYWPKGIATWGMGLLEGEKMSSSKGHAILTQKAVENWGADTTRFFLFASVEPWQDFNWREEEVEKYQNKLRAFYNRITELYNSGEEREYNDLDRYTLSKLQEIKENATEGLEDFQTRKAGMNGFFQLNSLINRYRKRSEELNREVINEVIEAQIRLMAPFTPHICEELWSEIGKDGLVAQAEWPTPDEELRKPEVEKAQEVVDSTVDDIRELSEIVGEFNKVKIVIAEGWKRELFRELTGLVDERPEFGEAMGRLVKEREQHSETIKDYLKEYLNNPGELPTAVFETEREVDILSQNRKFLEEEFDADIEIEKEADSEEDKAERAEPARPAIVLE